MPPCQTWRFFKIHEPSKSLWLFLGWFLVPLFKWLSQVTSNEKGDDSLVANWITLEVFVVFFLGGLMQAAYFFGGTTSTFSPPTFFQVNQGDGGQPGVNNQPRDSFSGNPNFPWWWMVQDLNGLLLVQEKLAGGFKYFFFWPLFGEDSQFD